MRSAANRRASWPSATRSSSRYGFTQCPPLKPPSPRGSLHVLAELGLALLLERIDAFLRFLSVVEELQRVHPHAGDAGLMGGVHVEAALGDGESGRAALAQLLAPFLHLGVQLLMWHADVGEAHRDRLLTG